MGFNSAQEATNAVNEQLSKANPYPASGTRAFVVEMNISLLTASSQEVGLVFDSHGNSGLQYSTQSGAGVLEGSIEAGIEITNADDIFMLRGESLNATIGAGEGAVASFSVFAGEGYQGASATVGAGVGNPVTGSIGTETTTIIPFTTQSKDK